MLVDVQALFFDTSRNPEAVYDIKPFEDYEPHSGSPAAYYHRPEQLCQLEVRAAAVEKPFFGSEQPRQDGSEAPANTVHGRGAYRIVYLQDMVEKVDRIDHHRPADDADDGRSSRRYQVATGSDTD